jgi:uncharacterized protein YlxP (DUF503 family)
MRIGVVRLRLHLHGPTSLKEKRQVLQSLMAHLRRRFNVSIAEVDRLDDWKSAVLGAAIVCNDGGSTTRSWGSSSKPSDTIKISRSKTTRSRFSNMSRWGRERLQSEIHEQLSEILQFEARDPVWSA